MLTKTLKLETPDQFKCAMRIQNLNTQMAVLKTQMAVLQSQETQEIQAGFGVENAIPIRITEDELVVQVASEKSHGKPGKSIRSPNGNHRGTEKGSRFTSDKPTPPTKPTKKQSG